jgi:hypothetical protein
VDNIQSKIPSRVTHLLHARARARTENTCAYLPATQSHKRNTTSIASLFFVFKPVYINFSACLSSFSSFHHIRLPTVYGMKGRGSIPPGSDFSLWNCVQRDCRGQPNSYPMVTGVLSLRLNRRNVKPTAHIHLVLTLRIPGALPPLLVRQYDVVHQHGQSFTLHQYLSSFFLCGTVIVVQRFY